MEGPLIYLIWILGSSVVFIANVGSCHQVLVVPFAALEQRFRVVCSGGTPHHSQHNNVETRGSMKLKLTQDSLMLLTSV